MTDSLIKWSYLPQLGAFGKPDSNTPNPDWPFSFQNSFLKDTIYPLTLNGYFPALIAITYFTTVHLCNKIVLERQINQFKASNPKEKLPKNLKHLKAAPYKVTKSIFFKPFVLVHNVFLCVYSVWTFIGMTSTIHHLASKVTPVLFKNVKSPASNITSLESFWQSICNNNIQDFDIWRNHSENLKGLTFFAYLFYLSKYYEILDTIIILLKGRPSSLLQSYHHSGAILCMWSGVRYMSPPIWIFVVFNSFIHSLMYFYFSLSCLKIRLPKWFKQSLTSLQITQFIVGGSLAVIHLFVQFYNLKTGEFHNCIATSEQAMAVYVNVFYLAPLTLLFAAFYIDSYRKKVVPKKDQ